MSVHQLKDGRWIVRYVRGTDPDNPGRTREYFGRGAAAERAARERNDELTYRRLRPYDLRHSAISAMFKDGADLKSVSEIAGHSRPSTTTNVYQHVDETMHRAAIEKIPPENEKGWYLFSYQPCLCKLVEMRGIEPLTSALRTPRSPI